MLYMVTFTVSQRKFRPRKRVIALSAFARCLKEGASPSHWDGPQCLDLGSAGSAGFLPRKPTFGKHC